MKSFRQLVLRRTRAPKQAVRQRDGSGTPARVAAVSSAGLPPVANAMRIDIPSEVIDLRITPLPASRPRVSGRRGGRRTS